MQWGRVWEIYWVKKTNFGEWGSPRGKHWHWLSNVQPPRRSSSSATRWRWHQSLWHCSARASLWEMSHKTEPQGVVIIQTRLGKEAMAKQTLAGVFKEKVGFRLLVRIWDLCWGHGLILQNNWRVLWLYHCFWSHLPLKFWHGCLNI